MSVIDCHVCCMPTCNSFTSINMLQCLTVTVTTDVYFHYKGKTKLLIIIAGVHKLLEKDGQKKIQSKYEGRLVSAVVHAYNEGLCPSGVQGKTSSQGHNP